VIAITAHCNRKCNFYCMKNVEHSVGFFARIRELDILAAATDDIEMLGILHRLVLAYREVARSEVCGVRRTCVVKRMVATRAIAGPSDSAAARTQALTRG
jgi:hypothetical protein